MHSEVIVGHAAVAIKLSYHEPVLSDAEIQQVASYVFDRDSMSLFMLRVCPWNVI
jgi:hypothetical protein